MSSPAVTNDDRAFIDFVADCQAIVAHDGDPLTTRDQVAARLADFAKDWRMPDHAYRQLQPDAPYASYLLFLNAAQTLNVVMDIYLPNQAAVTHNHRTWGCFVCLEGAERERLYDVPHDLSARPVETLVRDNPAGVVRSADPPRHAFHQVEPAGVTAISLHVYGADIGRLERDLWDTETRSYRPFRSGYANQTLGLGPYYERTDV